MDINRRKVHKAWLKLRSMIPTLDIKDPNFNATSLVRSLYEGESSCDDMDSENESSMDRIQKWLHPEVPREQDALKYDWEEALDSIGREEGFTKAMSLDPPPISIIYRITTEIVQFALQYKRFDVVAKMFDNCTEQGCFDCVDFVVADCLSEDTFEDCRSELVIKFLDIALEYDFDVDAAMASSFGLRPNQSSEYSLIWYAEYAISSCLLS